MVKFEIYVFALLFGSFWSGMSLRPRNWSQIFLVVPGACDAAQASSNVRAGYEGYPNITITIYLYITDTYRDSWYIRVWAGSGWSCPNSCTDSSQGTSWDTTRKPSTVVLLKNCIGLGTSTVTGFLFLAPSSNARSNRTSVVIALTHTVRSGTLGMTKI